MARIIPIDYNFKTDSLDCNETFIRDGFKLNIENWAKFRYKINIGTDSSVLSSPELIESEVRQAYREFGKAHYEIVTSLGSINIALLDATQYQFLAGHIFFTKSLKDFYFHIGILLDNLARLIFLVNHPNSAKETDKRGLKRHFLDWGKVKTLVTNKSFLTASNYSDFFSDNVLEEIINVRNNIAHNWISVSLSNSDTKVQYWPMEIRTSRNYYWPYEEIAEFRDNYKTLKPIIEILEADLQYVEDLQNRIFEQLIKDIGIYETNNNIKIN